MSYNTQDHTSALRSTRYEFKVAPLTEPTGAFAPFEVHVDLRQYKEVQQWLKKKGIVDWSTSGEVLQWVPEGIVVADGGLVKLSRGIAELTSTLSEDGGLCPAAGLGQGDSHLFTR